MPRAAHYLATSGNSTRPSLSDTRSMFGIKQTRDEISRQINEHRDLRAVDEMLAARELPDREMGLWGFVSLVGQLGFQKRWAQTPRIPRRRCWGTALVAVMAYFISMELEACPAESTTTSSGVSTTCRGATRDIVSPVKILWKGLTT